MNNTTLVHVDLQYRHTLETGSQVHPWAVQVWRNFVTGTQSTVILNAYRPFKEGKIECEGMRPQHICPPGGGKRTLDVNSEEKDHVARPLSWSYTIRTYSNTTSIGSMIKCVVLKPCCWGVWSDLITKASASLFLSIFSRTLQAPWQEPLDLGIRRTWAIVQSE